MLNTVTQAATTAAAAPADNVAGAQPAQNVPATPGTAQPLDAAAIAQPFAQWLGQQAQAAVQAVQTSLPADEAQADAPATAMNTAEVPDDAADEDASALPQENVLLAAMSMPLMPLSPAQIAQAVQAAQPASAGKPADTKDAAAQANPAAVSASTGAADDSGAVPLPQLASIAPAQHMQAQRAQPQPQPDSAAAAPARPAAHQQAAAGAAFDAPAQDAGAERSGTTANGPAVAQVGAASQAPAAAPAGDTVKLAGPPTAWRQSLQEALGDRLHVQVGSNIEQAVIRLEPPQLGRIDIAIRHSAGTLEVNISATHSEVLRQLQTVSDNLRNDLSQRQFTEVAVTVAPAPKNQAAPFGDPQQGRGRQQGRDQEDNQPGRALAETGNADTSFSLG